MLHLSSKHDFPNIPLTVIHLNSTCDVCLYGKNNLKKEWPFVFVSLIASAAQLKRLWPSSVISCACVCVCAGRRDFATHGLCSPPPLAWTCPGKNTGVGCYFLPQEKPPKRANKNYKVIHLKYQSVCYQLLESLPLGNIFNKTIYHYCIQMYDIIK